MKFAVWRALSALLVVLFAALFAVALFGGCNTLIETATGTVPMKCHWTFVAERFVALLGVVAALLVLVSSEKAARRASCIMVAAVAVVAIVLPTPLGIGICAAAEMGCHLSAIATWVMAAVALVVAAALFIKADPQAADKPKRSL